MRASMQVNVGNLKRLGEKLQSSQLKGAVEQIPQEKAIAGLIAQSIADNFAKEGPGWLPLKAATIRRSLSKKLRGEAKKMSDKELLQHEKRQRDYGMGAGFRKILQKTRLLYKTVTTPNFSGSNKKGQVGSNIYKVTGSRIWWGTNLIYARAMNKGNPKKKVPARRFLIIRQEWKEKITVYVLKRYKEIIKASLGTKTT